MGKGKNEIILGLVEVSIEFLKQKKSACSI